VRLLVRVPGVGRNVLRLLPGRTTPGGRSVSRETTRDLITIVACTIVIAGAILIARGNI
jgi:hypothetical protein